MRVSGHALSGRASGGVIHLINSGAATLDATGWHEIDGRPAIKSWWQVTADERRRCLEATTWYPAMTEYFRGGGYSSGFLTRGGMPVTMFRLNLVKGLGPALQITQGWTVDLPESVHAQLNERTNPTWPTHWFVPDLSGEGAFRDVYSVMANWGANHGTLSYGHIGADLISLASLLRIPVCMHNVPAEGVFRPSAWSAFGTHDPEGADYRACANFGPLYG
jgi:L-fucose isomerase